MNQAVSVTRTAYSALIQSITPIVLAIQPIGNLAANLIGSRVVSPAVGPVHTWPIYSNPYI